LSIKEDFYEKHDSDRSEVELLPVEINMKGKKLGPMKQALREIKKKINRD
jgi:hypothetical protein